jgi:septum formation protein
VGLAAEVVPGDVDESTLPGEPAEACAQRLARSKAAVVALRRPEAIVLAADTIVTIDGLLLGKPLDEADFRRTLALLSGRTHRVITAVAVRRANDLLEQAVCSDVSMRSIPDRELSWYWQTGEPRDKAGGYALQGAGGVFIERVNGSHSNVIGLPLLETLALLERAGLDMPWSVS